MKKTIIILLILFTIIVLSSCNEDTLSRLTTSDLEVCQQELDDANEKLAAIETTIVELESEVQTLRRNIDDVYIDECEVDLDEVERAAREIDGLVEQLNEQIY